MFLNIYSASSSIYRLSLIHKIKTEKKIKVKKISDSEDSLISEKDTRTVTNPDDQLLFDKALHAIQ